MAPLGAPRGHARHSLSGGWQMAIAKTVVCFAYVVMGVLGLLPVAAAIALLGHFGLRRPMLALGYRVAQGWARGLIALVGCKMTVVGRENVPRSGGVCFVSNHSSIVDILMLLGYAGRQFGFVAKRELMAVPFLNLWISVLGGLFIDRKSPRRAMKTISAGAERIRAGAGMIIFPEGSRSRGRGLLPFRPGALRLAALSEAAIVPVAISGTYGVFEKTYRACACPVRIAFCPPISVAEIPAEERKLALAERVRAVIAEALGEEAAAGPGGGEGEGASKGAAAQGGAAGARGAAAGEGAAAGPEAPAQSGGGAG